MKRFGVGLLALAIPFAAYAAKNSQTIDLRTPVQVGSTTVPAGPVRVTWSGTGSDAKLTFAHNGKDPITVPAEIVNKKNSNNAISTITVNGVDYLQEVELSNMTLVVRSAPTATAQNGN
jgi:hypothetical protein